MPILSNFVFFVYVFSHLSLSVFTYGKNAFTINLTQIDSEKQKADNAAHLCKKLYKASQLFGNICRKYEFNFRTSCSRFKWLPHVSDADPTISPRYDLTFFSPKKSFSFEKAVQNTKIWFKIKKKYHVTLWQPPTPCGIW